MSRRYANFSRFPGGMVYDYQAQTSATEPHDKYASSQASLLQNVVIKPGGKIATRCGMQYVSRNGDIIFYMASMDGVLYAKSIDKLWYFNGTTWAQVAAYPTGTFPYMVAFEDNLYIGGSSGISKLTVATGAWSTISSAPKVTGPFVVHNDRIWTVDSSTPLVIQGTEAGDPDDWTNGYSFTLPGEKYAVEALASLDGDLYIFTSNGIWLLTGYSESDFYLTKLTNNEGSCGFFYRTIVQCDFTGRGRSLAFVNKQGRLLGVDRGGLFEVCSSYGGNFTLNGDVTSCATYVPGPGLLLVADLGVIIAVHCKSPFRHESGRTQWPITKFTFPGTGTATITRVDCMGSAWNSSTGTNYTHIFAHDSEPIIIPGPSPTSPYVHFKYAEVEPSSSIFYAADTTRATGAAAPSYWEVQGKIRTLPFDANAPVPKDWRQLTVKVNTPPTHMANFTVNQYMDRTTTYPNAITATANEDMAFELYGSTEDTMIELNLYEDSTAKAAYADAANHIELHDMVMEFNL